MSIRTQRVAEQIQIEISTQLIREVNDPRVRGITITGVDVSPDLRHAKVFWTLSGSESKKKSAQKGLDSVSGYLRRELASKLHLKNVPELRFFYDDSLDRVGRIEELLREQDGPKEE